MHNYRPHTYVDASSVVTAAPEAAPLITTMKHLKTATTADSSAVSGTVVTRCPPCHVEKIIADIRARGDVAVREYSERFDHGPRRSGSTPSAIA